MKLIMYKEIQMLKISEGSKVKKTYLFVGILLIIAFLFAVYQFITTDCVSSIISPAVCGDNAKLIIFGYAIGALFGIYLIIKSLKGKIRRY